MTDLRGWSLPEQHLMPDAVVAFVDGELSPSARDRVAAHMISCSSCAAEIAAQRQARAAVRAADAPSMPAALLASLRAIPQNTELPDMPDGLAMTKDGKLVAVQRPDRSPLGAGSSRLGSNAAALGSQPPLGQGPNVIGRSRRTAQGAGVVVSGLVLGALALVAPSGSPHNGDATAQVVRPPKAPVQVAPVLVGPGPIIR